jgi:hypothetical protein
LLKKYRNLWVFGDSYSTPNICVDPTDSFWMDTARILKVDKIYNYSWPGNSFDSVIHNLTSESGQFDWKNDFILIGVPPLVRLTVVSNNDTKAYYRRVFDTDAKEIGQEQILCHHGLKNIHFYDDPTAIRFEDQTWTEIQACRNIFLLNQWLDSKEANYLIINLSKDFMTDFPATGRFLQETCFNHPRNILVGDTCYNLNLGVNKPTDFDTYGWSGHHGSAGNKHFFKESILTRLKNNNLI